MDTLYSIRMRSAAGGDHRAGGRHISGAERLIPKSEIARVMEAMVQRAQVHERGEADFINMVVEKMETEKIIVTPALPITTITVDDYQTGRNSAQRLLERIGISPDIARQAIQLLSAPEHEMRGAVLLDIGSGNRMEPDQTRGIRASRMDIHFPDRCAFKTALAEAGLTSEHTREALVLATKVCNAPGVVAEICWSDDPGYTAGYVASAQAGYVRITHLKPAGLAHGGRVFFVDTNVADIADTIAYLEKQPVLVSPVQLVRQPMTWQEYERCSREV